MALGIGLCLEQRQRQHLSQTQKLTLKQILSLKQRLKHPEFPNALKGLDGILAADGILKENDAFGILIGGLAESVWNQRRKEEDLARHKDVDVLVLDKRFCPEDFYGGIDWWVARTEKNNYQSDFSKAYNIEKTWYENGVSFPLSFGIYPIEVQYCFKSGLYIPSPEWVIEMREYEAKAVIPLSVEFDDEVWDKFRNCMKKKVKTKLPKFLNSFKERIVNQDRVSLESFNREILSSIRSKQSEQ